VSTGGAHSQRFAYGPGIALSLSAKPSIMGHFRAEYKSAAVPSGGDPADVDVEFVRHVEHADGLSVRGGYKTARWRVLLSTPGEHPLRARIAIAGAPLSFGLSLVQGYFVEPLIAVAAARSSCVLLPSAAVGENGGAVVLMGPSRSGKSSLSARALAAGQMVLGDDQVLVDGAGRCWAFPRRVRIYSDLRDTAPAAYARLGAGTRAALTGRRLVRALTRGYVAPPVRVPFDVLGEAASPAALSIVRVVLIERSSAVESLTGAPLDIGLAIAKAQNLLERQRDQLGCARDPAWAEALQETSAKEASILRATFANASLHHLLVPERWSAAHAVTTLAQELGTER
jgi:hypothetical protein